MTCRHVRVPRDACKIVFADGECAYSEMMGGMKTPDGSTLVLDLNAADEVIAIEIVGNRPCQQCEEPMWKVVAKLVVGLASIGVFLLAVLIATGVIHN